jgi:hypothetical protein
MVTTRAQRTVLTFKDAAALGRFLERAKRKGFRVLGRIDRFNTVRISLDSYDDLATDFGEYARTMSNLGGNVLFSAPQPTSAGGPRRRHTSAHREWIAPVSSA